MKAPHSPLRADEHLRKDLGTAFPFSGDIQVRFGSPARLAATVDDRVIDFSAEPRPQGEPPVFFWMGWESDAGNGGPLASQSGGGPIDVPCSPEFPDQGLTLRASA